MILRATEISVLYNAAVSPDNETIYWPLLVTDERYDTPIIMRCCLDYDAHPSIQVQESRAEARKPRDAASVLFGWSSPTTFLTSIRLAICFESQASELQTCWRKTQFNTKSDSKSFKVTCLDSVKSSEAISNHNVGFNC